MRQRDDLCIPAAEVPALAITAGDLDPRLLAIAARKGLRTEIVDFDQPLPFAPGHFDFVFMFDSIEHVRSRDAIFAEVQRVLRADGTLVVLRRRTILSCGSPRCACTVW